jgi:hypothetical protein
LKFQKELFELLREELENTIVRHKLRAVHAHHGLEDMEK